MKEKINNYLVMFMCILVGAGVTYLVLTQNPNVVYTSAGTQVLNQNRVTVTDKGIADGVENIYESVVVVESFNDNVSAGSGTGFAYKKENGYIYVMTNHHVIASGNSYKLYTSENTEISATLVGSDAYADIAILKVAEKDIKKIANIGKTENMRVGDTVFTIGTPVDTSYAGTVTRGILSGKNRLVSVSVSNSYSDDWIMNVMQTDAAINPGNSGGPLCNVSGEVIGINSMKIVQSSVEGLGFAIPIEDALEYANMITSGTKIERPYLGIQMIDVNSTYALMQESIKVDSSITSGVVIISAESGSPAGNAKLQKGDVIVKIEDHDIRTIAEFRYYLYKNKPGDTITIKYIRDKKENIVKVKLSKIN